VNPRARCPEILVVDDEPGVRDALRLLLEDDYTISEAANGADALAIARQRTCDLVMLDLLMPGLDGMVVLERLRAHAPTTKVIVLTGVDSSRVAVTAIKLGAFDYLTKPIIEEDLREAIRQALGPLPQASERAQARALVIGHDAGWRSSVAALLSERLGPGAVAAASFASVQTLTDVEALVVDVVGRQQQSRAMLREIAASRRHRETVIWADATFQARASLGSSSSIFRGRGSIGHMIRHVVGALRPDARPLHAFTPATLRALHVVSHAYVTASVEGIASTVGFSSRHLARVFGEDAGMTLKTCLLRVRLEAAKTLLHESSAKLETVAKQVGLCDASHMGRVFRHLEGVSPGAFRTSVSSVSMSEMS
jgi:YesN/AraC family two-component response regulator